MPRAGTCSRPPVLEAYLLSGLRGTAPRRPYAAALFLADGAMKILFVDDDADTSWTFTELAKLMGHDAVSATTGAQALEEARRYLPDLIFLDVLLGKDDGREVCALLRCEPTLSRCAIFAVTGLPHAHTLC